MIVTRSQEIPFVEAGDPTAVEQTAEFLADMIDGRLPGFGILPDLEGVETIPDLQEAVHLGHLGITLQAARSMEPTINMPKPRREPRQNPIRPGATGIHLDGRIRNLPPRSKPTMRIRMHTADADNGANVLFALSEPGAFYVPEETAMYQANRDDYDVVHNELEQRGYDPNLFAVHTGKSRSPVRVGDESTHFDDRSVLRGFQMPLSTMVFISGATFGPSTVHSFNNDSEIRHPYISDLLLTSQRAI